MKVSVICTAKNAAATIAWTLESVCAQDLDEWEMVVVDDGSADATTAIVESFARRDERIRLVRTGGIGRAQALNLALREARAPLVANIDADDESHPARLRHQHACLRQHPELVLISSDSMLIYGDERPVWKRYKAAAAPVVVNRSFALNNPVDHSAVMMRRDAVLAIGGYQHALVDDYDLWVRLIEAGHRIGKLHGTLAAKRIHAGQFFLFAPRLRYLADSTRIQARAIRALEVSKLYWGLLPLRLLWGLLPVSLRIAFNRQFRKTSDYPDLLQAGAASTLPTAGTQDASAPHSTR